MSIAERSLHFLVEKWLVPTPSSTVRVTQFSRMRSTRKRYVGVEVLRATGSVEMFFSGMTTVRGACFRLRPNA